MGGGGGRGTRHTWFVVSPSSSRGGGKGGWDRDPWWSGTQQDGGTGQGRNCQQVDRDRALVAMLFYPPVNSGGVAAT